MKNLNNKKTKGFTIVEVVVVMSAIAVISSLSYPSFVKLYNRQVVESEKIALEEIKKAMEVYAKREGSLPPASEDCNRNKYTDDMWNVKLSWYSKLSPNEICYDQYGETRVYRTDTFEKKFGEYYYLEYYSTVTSKGKNHEDDFGAWKQKDFNLIKSKNVMLDDIVIKYTDKQHKLELYEENLKRVEKLEEYLERYARSKRSIALFNDEPDFDNKIFYPNDGDSVGDYYSPEDDEDGEGVDTIKETRSAISLTKVLGLPEYMGRDAITGESMLYISNPGGSRLKPCEDARTKPPFYPPTIIPLGIKRTADSLKC